MLRSILFVFSTVLYVSAETIQLPEINVTSSFQEEEPLIAMQETTPGMKQPVINGLMGDKILITLDNNKFSNALFRSGPNQYYSWVPDQFVLSNRVNENLLNSSLGGTVNRSLGIDSTKLSIEAGTNTFTGLISYHDDTFEAGLITIDNKNVVTPYDGEVEHSSYNQKGLYLSSNSSYGRSKFMLTQSDDIDRTDKFEKDDYYVYELQRYLMFSHEYHLLGTNMVIMPSWQRFQEKIDRDSPLSKNIKSTDDIFGLNISDKHSNIFTKTDIFKYGLTNHYEDISYTKGMTDTDYHYNTFSVWASYYDTLNDSWDYALSYNFSYLDTKGGAIDRSMNGNAFGLTLNYSLDDMNFLYGSINSNFKFPTITNLAEARSDSVEEIPNPYLDSEKAITAKIGISYKGFDLAIFHKKLYDMIIRVQTDIPDGNGGYKWKYENTDQGYIKGLSFGYYKELNENWKIRINAELLEGKTDYDYISKLQPVVTSTYIRYKDLWAEFLYAPSVPEDKMALKDQTDIRIKDHNYGYKILNLGYTYMYNHHNFNVYLDNVFNDRGRVYGSSVDFNERRLRVGYAYEF